MNDNQLEDLLIAVMKDCLAFGDRHQLEKELPQLFLVLKTCRALQFAIYDRSYEKSDIAEGIHHLNNLDADSVNALKLALQQSGFTNDKGKHRDLLNLASSYATIPAQQMSTVQQVSNIQQEITAEERLLKASQSFSFALDLFINHKDIAANKQMYMGKVLEIVWNYNIFRDYLNNNDAFSSRMDWDQFIDCLHNFSVQYASQITPPMAQPAVPTTPAILTAYSNQQSSSNSNSYSSSAALSNDNNSYLGHVASYVSNAFSSKQTLTLDEATNKLEIMLVEEVERKCLNPDSTFKSAGHGTLAEVSRQLRLAGQDRIYDFKFLRENINVLATSALAVNVNKFVQAGHFDPMSKNGTVRSLPEMVETMVNNAKRCQYR